MHDVAEEILLGFKSVCLFGLIDTLSRNSQHRFLIVLFLIERTAFCIGTEAIVEIALGLLKDEAAPFIADIGTGSGCIAISFLKERADARAVGSDISAAVLGVAGRNARRYGVSDRLALLESDSFVKFNPSTQFSLIAANPPYVPEADWANLPRGVRDHEPRAALVSGADGLDSIRRLLQDSPAFLRIHGFLLFEIGFGQAEAVRDLIEPSVWNLLEIRRDLQGIPRTVVLQKK